MNKILKTLVIFSLILIPVLVLAVDFSPQGNINLKSRYNITNYWGGACTNGTVTDILDNGSFVCSPEVPGLEMNWTGLKNYPVACPGGSYITALNDSVTCTAAMKTTGDSVTGNYTIDGNLNVTQNVTIGEAVLYWNGTALVIEG